MMMLRNLLLITALVVMLCACDDLGGSSPAKYKAELSTALLNLSGDIKDKADVSAATEQSLRKLYARHQEEYAGKQSMLSFEGLISCLDSLRAQPDKHAVWLEALDFQRQLLLQDLQNEASN